MYLLKIISLIFLLFISISECRTIVNSHGNPSELKHFESKLDDKIGYWSPSTSSIDWCERNYVKTKYLAEFWNSISSLSMCFLAILLLIQGFIYKIEKRFLCMSIAFGIVGFGSFYFHGTLTFYGQMLDELPMVYSMITCFYILFRMNSFHQNQYQLDKFALLAILYAFFWTYIHTLKSFVLIFQIHFALMALISVIKFIDLYRNASYYPSSIKYFILTYALLIIPAITIWLIDQHYCEEFNRSERNPQFHAWWHILCAIDCHVGIVCAQAMRHLTIKYHQFQSTNQQRFHPKDNLNMNYYFGLPFVDYSFNKQNNFIKNK